MNQLALNLLIELRTHQQYAQTPEILLRSLRVGGHPGLTLPELERALRDLADKSWAAPVEAPITGQRWRLTALGASALKEEGL